MPLVGAADPVLCESSCQLYMQELKADGVLAILCQIADGALPYLYKGVTF